MTTEPDNWPADPYGHVFLGRAVEAIGRERFPNKWNGAERLTYSVPSVLPIRKELATETDWYNAWQHLGYVRFERLLAIAKPKSWFADFLGRTTPTDWTDADWSIARDASIKLFKRLEPEAKRASAVRSEIAMRCQAGDLVSVARPIIGGAMTPIAPDAWNTDGLVARFYSLQIPLGDTFASIGPQTELGWIFITAESLERVLGFRDAKITDQLHLSPYMRAMVWVIEKEKITPKNQSRVELLSAIFMEKLKGIQPPISKHMTDVMATVIREPESQRLRGGRPPNRPKLGKAPNRKS